MRVEERNDAVVEQVCRGDRRLAIVDFREAHLRVRIDEGLLIDSPNALQRTDVERVLGSAVAWALALEFAVRFLLEFCLLERLNLRLRQHDAVAHSVPWTPGWC